MTTIRPSHQAWLRRLLGPGAAWLLVFGLAGCAGSSSPASAPNGGAQPSGVLRASTPVGASPASGGASAGAGGSGPCMLLTRAEAEQAVGQPLPTGSENAVLGSCDYSSADFAAGVDFTVSSWDSMVAAAHNNGAKPTSVSGVGDEALVRERGSDTSFLYVRKGTQGFFLLFSLPGSRALPDHGLAKAEAVAALIVARL